MPVKKAKPGKSGTVKSASPKKNLKKAIPLKPTAMAKKKSLKLPLLPAPRTKSKQLYIDACFFFPYNNEPFSDHLQDGRCSPTSVLVAPILLPVGSVMKSITVYYKNNTTDDISVWILKHHISHHAYSGEVEVSYESCPPGTAAPDHFLQTVINHFDAGGKILDQYMYHIEIGSTMKAGAQERLLRGIRIVYREPA